MLKDYSWTEKLKVIKKKGAMETILFARRVQSSFHAENRSHQKTQK